MRALKTSQGHPLASSADRTQKSLEKFVAFISIVDPFSLERKTILLLVTLERIGFDINLLRSRPRSEERN